MRKILILATLALSTSAFASSAGRACNDIGLPFESDIDRCIEARASAGTINACGRAGFVKPNQILECIESKVSVKHIKECVEFGYDYNYEVLGCIKN